MPTFYAMIAASASAYIVSGLLGDIAGALSVILSSIVWVLVFYSMKKWLTDLRP
ncbi:hypothetical protein [Desulfoluna sp.]|uniref:hypothetical protein n=1 Tax=Desulfoluna sp. TaxID=2045199 RepID=UPI00262FB315|nr:hypothetical protein [Desulfoluna sp.]